MALNIKRITKHLAVARKYSTEIPLDRVYEHRETGHKFIITNDYSVARNGITNQKELVIYYPEKFKFSLHPLYEQIKSSGAEYLTKFGIAMPATKQFSDIIDIRCDLVSALTFISDTHQTVSVDYARAYHDFLIFLYIHDDFAVKLLPKHLSEFEQQFTDKLKSVNQLNEIEMFDKNDCQLSAQEKQLADEANKIILALYDVSDRIRNNCGQNMIDHHIDCTDSYLNYSMTESNYKRYNKPLSWNQFMRIGTRQTGFENSFAFIDHNQPIIPHNDPWKVLAALCGRMFNDVLSHHKELISNDCAFANCVEILKSERGMSTVDAMAEVMRVTNKIYEDVSQHVEYMRDEEKHRYVRYFTHMIGFTEAQLVSKRFGWSRVSGTAPVYETYICDGCVHASQTRSCKQI